MPNRIVREGILTSEKIASLGWPEEVFYRRLMSVVDDYGRYEANPILLRSKCYPMQVDLVRAADITRWMAACQKAGVLLSYEVNGKLYLELDNFGQQQRSASKFPPPPTDASKCYQVPADAHLGVVVSVVEDVIVNTRKRGKQLKVSLPDGFGVSDRVRKWAAEKGHDRLEAHLDNFLLAVAKQGYVYADWDAAFMSAISDNWAKLEKSVAGRGSSPKVEKTKEQQRSDEIDGLRHMAHLGNADAIAKLNQMGVSA